MVSGEGSTVQERGLGSVLGVEFEGMVLSMVPMFIISFLVLIPALDMLEKSYNHFQGRRVILVLGCAPPNLDSPGVIGPNEITHLRNQALLSKLFALPAERRHTARDPNTCSMSRERKGTLSRQCQCTVKRMVRPFFPPSVYFYFYWLSFPRIFIF